MSPRRGYREGRAVPLSHASRARTQASLVASWCSLAAVLLSGCGLGRSPAATPHYPPPTASATRTAPAPAPATTATITLRATPAPNGTRSPDTATAQATQPTAPPVVAETAPAEELRRFDSQLHPYSILLPQGWSARGDAFRSGDVRGDLFSPPAREDVTLNILSEPLQGEALDTEGYARLTARAVQEATGQEPRRGRDATVAGATASVLEWDDRSRPLQVRQVTQAVWVASDRGWVATLSTPQGRRARYVPVFLRMLETMQLR